MRQRQTDMERKRETEREKEQNKTESEEIQAERQSKRRPGEGKENKLEVAGGVQAASQLQGGACQPGREGLAQRRTPAWGGGSWAVHLAVSAEPKPLHLTQAQLLQPSCSVACSHQSPFTR